MMNAKTEYVFKFLQSQEKKRVFVVTLDRDDHNKYTLFSRKTAFLTQSMHIKTRDDRRNVIVAFSTDTMMSYCLPTILLQRRQVRNLEDVEFIQQYEKGTARIHLTPLEDLKLHSSLMKMPLVVYMNAYCNTDDDTKNNEVFDVFFYENQDDANVTLPRSLLD